MKGPRLLVPLLLALSLQLFLLDSSNAVGQLSVTITTDKQSYGPGELITINGQVLDDFSQGVAFASVSVQVNDPNGNPIHITSILSNIDGTFADQFTVPAGSVDGGYTVFTTASKPGYMEDSNQTAYTVIPEFPISDMLWLMLIPILATLLARRRRLH